MNFIEIIIVLSITLGVTVINYLIFACSKLSPCYIEFDDRKRSEIKLMKEYNEGFKKIFMIYVVTVAIIAMLTLASFSAFVAYVLMAVQLMYTVGATLVMSWMYIRSRIYWELEFRKEEVCRASEIVDYRMVA